MAGDSPRCVACRLPIESGATKCPHCASYQIQGWRNYVDRASVLLALVLAIISVVTFFITGLPGLRDQLTRDKAILRAQMAGGGANAGNTEKHYDVLFVNYGLKDAIIIKSMVCNYLDSNGKEFEDAQGDKYGEAFNAEGDTSIEHESNKIITFDSIGGIGDDSALKGKEITSAECRIPFADVSNPPGPGTDILSQSVTFRIDHPI